jgi:hypothetical protein
VGILFDEHGIIRHVLAPQTAGVAEIQPQLVYVDADNRIINLRG